MNVAVTVNGTPREADVEPRTLLVYFLRESLGLTGTNVGCDTSSCGSCTVLLDGESVKSCTLLAAQVDGRSVTTIEGLAKPDGTLHPVQQAWIDEDAILCGYCQSGQIMAAVDLLARKPKPSDADIDGIGNLCRCGSYPRIRRAIQRAAAATQGKTK